MYKVVQNSKSVYKNPRPPLFLMKPIEQYMYFPVVLFIMLYNRVLTFESVDEKL